MVPVMLLAHLLGDYILQPDILVRWKFRSILGVIAHGGIVTLTGLAFVLLVAPEWWPYALLIGVTHTIIDVLRAQLLRPKRTSWELIWLLLDQLAHVGVILLVVAITASPTASELQLHGGRPIDTRFWIYSVGFLILLHPAWVLLRFTARAIWGATSIPALPNGEKYGPMLERVLIATLIVAGQFFLVPLVVLARRVQSVYAQNDGLLLYIDFPRHRAEALMSILLAMFVGFLLLLFRTGVL